MVSHIYNPKNQQESNVAAPEPAGAPTDPSAPPAAVTTASLPLPTEAPGAPKGLASALKSAKRAFKDTPAAPPAPPPPCPSPLPLADPYAAANPPLLGTSPPPMPPASKRQRLDPTALRSPKNNALGRGPLSPMGALNLASLSGLGGRLPTSNGVYHIGPALVGGVPPLHLSGAAAAAAEGNEGAAGAAAAAPQGHVSSAALFQMAAQPPPLQPGVNPLLMGLPDSGNALLIAGKEANVS